MRTFHLYLSKLKDGYVYDYTVRCGDFMRKFCKIPAHIALMETFIMIASYLLPTYATTGLQVPVSPVYEGAVQDGTGDGSSKQLSRRQVRC